MPLPKLSPLQSRMAASMVASLLLLLLYLALTSPNFAYASEIESIHSDGFNQDSLTAPFLEKDDWDESDLRDDMYEPAFMGVDRELIGRQEAIAPTDLPNNVGTTINVVPGSIEYYQFSNISLRATRSGPSTALPSSVIDLEKRQIGNETKEIEGKQAKEAEHHLEVRQATGNVTLYITANTCLQPSNPAAAAGSTESPPQLQLYVSTSSSNKFPGPNRTSLAQTVINFQEGFVNYTLNATSDVYVSVYAPNSSTFTSGVYSVQIAGSIDAQYHKYHYNGPDSDSNLHLIDSDQTTALLVTNNLTQIVFDPSKKTSYDEWMSISPPFDVFIFNQNDSSINGLSNSYCALKKLSDAIGLTVTKSMTNITEGSFVKEQMYVDGLNGSTTYYGMLALANSTNSTTSSAAIGGGGALWPTMSFRTQADNACAVVFNLSFCDQVAYAVPGNINNFPNATSLANWYDAQAVTAYGYFEKVLQQIPCEIETTGQYSLASTCDTCAAAYKAWLCSVTIPRCQDFIATQWYLQERNVVQAFPNGTFLDQALIDASKNIMYLNSSRNPLIDQEIKPGPYKEIKPCEGLCYDLVRTCPASMGFACPQPGMIGFDNSYGRLPQNASEIGLITCNYPGAVYGLSGTTNVKVPGWAVSLLVVGALFLLL